jgi:DNA-binding PadR family transcriptional regulator
LKAHDHLPLTETSFFILLSLATTPKHGYGILKEVQAMSAGRVILAAGTLYSALRRMLEDGWIERLEDDPAGSDNRDRKLYRLSDTGKRILALETDRLHALVRLISLRKAGEYDG